MQKLYQQLSMVDKLFALLRILVFLGGLGWTLLAPLSSSQQSALLTNFGFFLFYSALLYLFIFSLPSKIRRIYVAALFLDLVFIYWLVHLTGGFSSDFFLAFLLIVALHSFYFGLRFGIGVIFLSILVYLAAGGFALSRENILPISLQTAFLFLVGISMGLLSRKEMLDRNRIQGLNEELERQRAELELEKNKLSKILMGIDVGLVLLNTDREIIWMNKVVERWFGPAPKHLGRTCNQTLWNSSEICKGCPTGRCLESGTLETGEIESPQDDSDKITYFRITSAPLLNDAGKIDRILELIQDVTEEREMQLHMIQTSKLAAMGELAGGVAHEINNPLGAISVYVQEIGERLKESEALGKADLEIQENILAIRREIQRCKRITTGLLSIAPRTEPRRSPLDINQLIRNVRLLVRYKAEKERKSLQLELDPALPMIMGEADTLSQVFLNLTLNAIEFSPAGQEIEIRTGTTEAGKVFIQFRDKGCGIPHGNLRKIFKPFFTTKPPGTGTGLGLPISQRIVRSHGGEIEVESSEKSGSCFMVYLPINTEPTLA